MTDRIPFTDLQGQYAALKTSIDARIQRVLDHGQYILGPEVGELEAKLAAYTGARSCITVASGTEALLIALMAIDLKPGDEVITTSFTFPAPAEMIVLLGGKPVFVDIEPDTFNIDASLIEAAITKRTRAIIPVSLFGQCADLDAINGLAERHGLSVIEDAAQSFGATFEGRKSCNLSTLGCTSFFPSKPLGCYGDGGAIFTNDDALAQICREIRSHGQSGRYLHTRIGVGGRMDTLQCAVALAKLERFEWEIVERRAIATRYTQALENASGVRAPIVRPGRDSAWAQYTVLVENRAHVQSTLLEHGVPSAVHYPRPVHHQPAFSGRDLSESCPRSTFAAERVLSIPMSADLSPQHQERVVGALLEATGGGARATAGAGGLRSAGHPAL